MEKTITLVPGTKMSIEAKIDGTVITMYEPEKEKKTPKFKDGDIIYCQYIDETKGGVLVSWISIVKEMVDECFIKDHASLMLSTNDGKKCPFLEIDSYQDVEDIVMVYATEGGKQKIFNALAKEGKVWNAEKKCIEELRCKPKPLERYFFIDDEMAISSCAWTDEPIDENRYKGFNCFRNEQDADKALPHIKEAFKNWNKK